VLSHHPLGGGFLAVPGLEELLGQSPQNLGIRGGVNGSTHALQLELLPEGEGEGFCHGGTSNN
jgi:hypothetical protein